MAVAVGVLARELGAEALVVLGQGDRRGVRDVLFVRFQHLVAIHVHLPEGETHALEELG